MASPALEEPEKRYTLTDYLTWDGPERYELENGRAVLMASAGMSHNQVITELLGLFREQIRKTGSSCVTVTSTDVILPNPGESDDEASTVYVPDVLILCDQSKVRNDKIFGAPEFVVEVLSDSTASRDIGVKRAAYQAAGVREYWVIDRATKTILKFDFVNNATRLFQAQETISLDSLNLDIEVGSIFPDS